MDGLEAEAFRIAEDAKKTAEFYEANPGLVDHRAVIDLYRTIERLADAIERQLAWDAEHSF